MMEKFTGAFVTEPQGTRYAPQMKRKLPRSSKLLHNLEEAFQAIPVQNGMTLSFHHHLRNGDAVLNMVLDVAARLGLKDLTIATSAVFPVHAPLVEHIQNGVVTAIDTNYISGPVAKAVSHGLLAKPVMFRTHGGRARAIESGDLKIDVAFIAAPTADDYGNLNGVDGPSACGSLGYADSDATYAEHVVAVTDHLVDYPAAPISIDQTRVDYVVVTERGVAVNPLRQELRTRLLAAGIPVVDIKKLQEMAEVMTGKPKLVPHGKRVVAYVEYRDGTIIDEIYETGNQ